MTDASLKPVIDKLETLFSSFNAHFYEDELQKPVITVSPDMTKGAYGWCTAYKAWNDSADDEGGFYEINICAEHLSRPFDEVVSTLLHEMAHLYNLQIGVQDTSRGGTYHNKMFKAAAENHGLICEKDAKYGWTITKLNDEAKAFLGEHDDGFQLHRKPMPKALKAASEKKSSRKYVCPSCGCIVRATKEVHIICADCGVEFEENE